MRSQWEGKLSLARVGRTLLSAAFDLDFEFDFEFGFKTASLPAQNAEEMTLGQSDGKN